MLYLLYLRNGFIKKFPLDKKKILLGRSENCDFYLDEAFISKEHAEICPHQDFITVKDLGSTNGAYTDKGKIRKARIYPNEWFRIGYLKFFLKEGNAEEFVLSDRIKPLLNRLSNAMALNAEKTTEALNILYTEPLVKMLQIGFSLEKYGNLFKYAENLLEKTLGRGCLLLLGRTPNGCRTESQWNFTAEYNTAFKRFIKTGNPFNGALRNSEIEGGFRVSAFPVISKPGNMSLVYLGDSALSPELTDFLEDLAVEIGVIQSLLEPPPSTSAKPNDTNGTKGTNGTRDKKTKKDKKIPEIITTNPDMLHLLSKCKKIAASKLFVLIEGETGTGKELFARFIHHHSQRAGGNFVALNCAAIPENLMENELFGHEKGAFTDASSRQPGKLELASGGTLVLDEIGDMPLNLQAKLLRTIQEGQFYRVGGNTPIEVDLRIICLTNKNVKELMLQNLFREDLYYRIAHMRLKIPPLRERKEDIVPLLNHFMESFSQVSGVVIKGVSDKAIKAMESYDWPGNVREFENEMTKILSLAENNDVINIDMLKEEIIDFYNTENPDTRTPAQEKAQLQKALDKHKWNKSLAAKELNMSRTTLYEKLKKHGLG